MCTKARLSRCLNFRVCQQLSTDSVGVGRSLAFRELRESLTQPEEERFRAHLVAYMAGETNELSL